MLTNTEIYEGVRKPTIRDNKVKQITWIWTCTNNGRQQNSQNSTIHEYGNKKNEEDQEIDG